MKSHSENGETFYFEDDNGVIKCPDHTYVPNPGGLGYELLHAMKHFENKVAQYIPKTNSTDTYGDLRIRCIRTALKMKSMGLRSGDLICICSDHHCNASVPYLAALMIGVTVSCLDERLTNDEVLHLLKIVKPKVIFANDAGVNLIRNIQSEIPFSMQLVSFNAREDAQSFDYFQEPNTKEEDFEAYIPKNVFETVVVAFSSGTTSAPKGVCLNHYTLLQRSLEVMYLSGAKSRAGISNFRQENIEDDSVFLCYSPFYWISATIVMISSILSGSARVLRDDFAAADFWNIADKYSITAFIGPPYLLSGISESVAPPECNLHSLRTILTGSCPVPPNLLRDLRNKLPSTWISQMYGATEIGFCATYFDFKDPTARVFALENTGSCGRPLIGNWYKVVDPETSRIVGPNQRGELLVKSKAMTTGYYNQDSGTPFDSEGWLKTGDIVYYNQDYCFFVVDRLKQMIKYKSWQISPTEIEQVILEHPAVKEAIVVGLPHPEDGDHPIAIVVLRPDVNASPENIRNFVDGRVEDKKRLRGGVKIVNSIPVTITGKVRRMQLKNLLLSNQLE